MVQSYLSAEVTHGIILFEYCAKVEWTPAQCLSYPKLALAMPFYGTPKLVPEGPNVKKALTKQHLLSPSQ